jgi:hypothetical protein
MDTREAEERAAEQASAAVRRAVLNACLSPDGYTRAEAERVFAATARRYDISPGLLIDDCLGGHWQQTPRHPALADTEHAAVRYELRVMGHCEHVKLDPECAQQPGEDDEDYAMRFWRWADPENMATLVQLHEARTAARVRAHDARQHRTPTLALPSGETETEEEW